MLMQVLLKLEPEDTLVRSVLSHAGSRRKRQGHAQTTVIKELIEEIREK